MWGRQSLRGKRSDRLRHRDIHELRVCVQKGHSFDLVFSMRPFIDY